MRLPAHFLIIYAMVLSLAGCGKSSQGITELRIAHSLDTNHPVHQAMMHMADVLDELSDGSMQIDIYPNGQLGSERELIELLQIGSLAMAKVSASPLEGFAQEMQIFSIPYIFRDQDHYWRTLEGPIGKELLLNLESVRLRGLTYYDAGSRSFYMRNHAVRTPSDLVGRKIRVQKSQTSVQMIETLGAAATPIAWGELYTALQQGIVDGAENNPPSFYLSHHYETSKYYILDEHTSVPDILIISDHIWDNLDKQQQSWLQQAAAESTTLQRKLWQEATEDALNKVREAGVEVILADKKPFREAIQVMHDSYRGTPISKLLDKIAGVK